MRRFVNPGLRIASFTRILVRIDSRFFISEGRLISDGRLTNDSKLWG